MTGDELMFPVGSVQVLHSGIFVITEPVFFINTDYGYSDTGYHAALVRISAENLPRKITGKVSQDRNIKMPVVTEKFI